MMSAGGKLASKQHARGQFPLEHFDQKDEVLWCLLHVVT
jgi:hypothetical protein